MASASADPPSVPGAVATADGSALDHITTVDDRRLTVHVYSAAMDDVIPLEVIRPADSSVPRPTLYLLNGAGGGEDSATWQARTDVVSFFADKNVNVVTPVGGAFSYYTDWKQRDPVLGLQKWTTFLTRELPPIVDATLGTTGMNAIVGLSMS
ncbi:MAG: alpha/beta hydrolase-fold protein, partial [Rhodococcus sp. (in: high G+C Gram-positive bacteria)]